MAGGGKRRQRSGDVKLGRRSYSTDERTDGTDGRTPDGRRRAVGERKKIVFHLQIIDVGGVDLFDREKKKRRSKERGRERGRGRD